MARLLNYNMADVCARQLNDIKLALQEVMLYIVIREEEEDEEEEEEKEEEEEEE